MFRDVVLQGWLVVRRPLGRGPYRKPMVVRVGELLTTNPTVWLIGFTIGVVLLVLTRVLGVTLGLLLVIPLVVVATAAADLKGRVMILRRRILLTRQSTTRRQFLATILAVLLVTCLTGALGWMLRSFILGGYEEQLRRHLTPRPKK